ncbi:MAG: SUMF1/EgtB/PvdO family nonheme iron enzyme [Polyangiaceae bacterium]
MPKATPMMFTRPFALRRLALVASASTLTLLASCKHPAPAPSSYPASDAATNDSGADANGNASDAAPPPARLGMVWISAGNLRAGTPVDHVPRIAEEELPGLDTPMSGFYIDQLPYPDEVGAIPTSNVSRADAAKLCAAKQKRLCSELEWERACKGENNTTYEYGDVYQKAACGTGVPVEQGARRPSGDRVTCKSSFGALEMHGGVWEWTDSSWRRGAHGDLGVLRGGNARAGELVGRCANAIARKPKSSSATMGFRCCAGDRNTAEVDLTIAALPAFTRLQKPEDVAAPFAAEAARKLSGAAAGTTVDASLFSARAAWKWHPVPNEELTVVSGCVQSAPVAGAAVKASGSRSSCGTVIARGGVPIQEIEGGHLAPEVALFGESRRIRMQSVDDRSAFVREITYVVGMIEIGPTKR